MDTFECEKKHFKFYAFLNLEPVQIKKMLIYNFSLFQSFDYSTGPVL